MDKTVYDALIIGSGFGGSMAAHQLVGAGMKVLMLERGSWVTRSPENWGMRGPVDLTAHYDSASPIRVEAGGNKKVMGLYTSVGGPSVFYGGVSFRFREQDFEANTEITSGSGAAWPLRYRDLEPYYGQAENLLNISGEAGKDPTEPRRSAPFPQGPAPLAGISIRLKTAAEDLRLRPFQLPLAINYSDNGRPKCINCTTCDTYACAISAKNDLSVTVLPGLTSRGLTLRANTVVTRLQAAGGRIRAVEGVCRETGRRLQFRARLVVLSAGALASPHLLLASGLHEINPGGRVIGRYLMRHVNAIIFGIFPGKADPQTRFHKQLAIMDYYFGLPQTPGAWSKLGSLQQMPTPPAGLVQQAVPGILGKWLSRGVPLLTGLLAIAEDQPQFSNQLVIDRVRQDAFGLPQPVIRHHYTGRDRAALGVLVREAKKILRRSGAVATYVHPIRTFSHAVGTVRMGYDPADSALDENCRFRGIGNLYVVDGSFMPTSAAVNPSLTIAANALRIGEGISKI
ncbi:MAG: GMC family oxidoreductase [Saprospirales bacterium]|nr:GMC family oxidoreductase [Saprospirales bacterium]